MNDDVLIKNIKNIRKVQQGDVIVKEDFQRQ